MIDAYLARVIDRNESSDTIDAIGLAGTLELTGVRMLRRRANPLAGEAGCLPELGEVGIVLKFPEYGDKYNFWLGSFHNLVSNICALPAIGDKLSQEDNGTWYRVAADGTTEISHPAGVKVIIGGTSLSARTYQRKKSGTMSTRESRPYPQLQMEPKTLYIEHARKTVASTFENFSEDKRKQTVTNADTQKLTKFTLDDVGNLEIDHQTDADTHYTFTLDKDGNLAINIPGNETITVVGNLIVNALNATVNATQKAEVTAQIISLIATTLNMGAEGLGDGNSVVRKSDLSYALTHHTHTDPQGGNTGVGTDTSQGSSEAKCI